MSAYSDWKCGALTDEEYASWGAEFNRRERAYEYEQEYYDEENDEEE